MNFGEKVTLIRKQKKLSQAELGKRSVLMAILWESTNAMR